MITIVDYGMGNLKSVSKAFEKLGFDVNVTSNPKDILNAGRLVLPGVGAFKDCMNELEKRELVCPIKEFILKGNPFLGICLGLQLLFTSSDEFGKCKGMNIVPGVVRRFPQIMVDILKEGEEPNTLKIPHMGWNQISLKKHSLLWEGISDFSYFYFVHSYYVIPDNMQVVASNTTYGLTFVSSIESGNIFATQFHPEKSQRVGLKLLENFGRWKV